MNSLRSHYSVGVNIDCTLVSVSIYSQSLNEAVTCTSTTYNMMTDRSHSSRTRRSYDHSSHRENCLIAALSPDDHCIAFYHGAKEVDKCNINHLWEVTLCYKVIRDRREFHFIFVFVFLFWAQSTKAQSHCISWLDSMSC